VKGGLKRIFSHYTSGKRVASLWNVLSGIDGGREVNVRSKKQPGEWNTCIGIKDEGRAQTGCMIKIQRKKTRRKAVGAGKWEKGKRMGTSEGKKEKAQIREKRDTSQATIKSEVGEQVCRREKGMTNS